MRRTHRNAGVEGPMCDMRSCTKLQAPRQHLPPAPHTTRSDHHTRCEFSAPGVSQALALLLSRREERPTYQSGGHSSPRKALLASVSSPAQPVVVVLHHTKFFDKQQRLSRAPIRGANGLSARRLCPSMSWASPAMVRSNRHLRFRSRSRRMATISTLATRR